MRLGAGKRLARSAIYTTITVWWNISLFNARIGMVITLLKIKFDMHPYALKVLINKHQTDDTTRRIEYRWNKEIVHEIITLCKHSIFYRYAENTSLIVCLEREILAFSIYCRELIICKKSLKIPKGGNQNPYIDEKQTTQWPKEKVQKDKQRSTKYTHKTKDRVTWTQLTTGVNSDVPEGLAVPAPLVSP